MSRRRGERSGRIGARERDPCRPGRPQVKSGSIQRVIAHQFLHDDPVPAWRNGGRRGTSAPRGTSCSDGVKSDASALPSHQTALYEDATICGRDSSGMFVLAHLSDPHLGPIPDARLSEVFGKRFFGLMNWVGARRRNFGAETLAPLMADLAAQAPDHIAVTGDLVNLSLPAEFDTGAAFLASLGPPDRVTVIPAQACKVMEVYC